MQNNTSSLAIPVAIVIGFGMIAVAIYFAGISGGGANQGAAVVQTGSTITDTTQRETYTPIRPPEDGDHIRGNPNAEIAIVEYSDYDCPFCKRFHETMKGVLATEEGQAGTVSWVYRHFPIQTLHPNAPTLSHASECVAELGGHTAFWEFSDMYYDQQGQVADLTEFGSRFNISSTDFTACMDEQRHLDRVKEDLEEVVKAGGRGTPYNVFVFEEEMNAGLRDLVSQLNVQTQNSFNIISNNQLGMSGAFDQAIIMQIITAYKGLSL